MTEYLMLFPERDVAEDVAEDLMDDAEFSQVRVVRDAFAGEEDDEDHQWGVHVRQDTIDDPASAVARALAERFDTMARERGGFLDDNPAQDPVR